MAKNLSWWRMHTSGANQHSVPSSSSSSSLQLDVHGFVDSSMPLNSDTALAHYCFPASNPLLGGDLGGGGEDQGSFGSRCFMQQPAQSISHQLCVCDELPLSRQPVFWPFGTSSSRNAMDFPREGTDSDHRSKNHKHTQNGGHPYEHNSIRSTADGASKKARAQQLPTQPALKVRREKIGDRITALHQLVSPFGKTDTASVLSESIASIRFLQTQIQVLCTPYMREQYSESRGKQKKDLRSKGLCLVPISCTRYVENSTGTDYWGPSSLVGGF